MAVIGLSVLDMADVGTVVSGVEVTTMIICSVVVGDVAVTKSASVWFGAFANSKAVVVVVVIVNVAIVVVIMLGVPTRLPST